jgi:hypothetical protein
MRFSADQADNYGNNGGSSFFRLQNDGDVARVRFMYNKMEDVEGYAVHEVQVDDKRKYVNCIREYNDPKDVCPFCASGKSQLAKLYIPLYNVDADKVQVWERGKKFLAKMSSICARYASADTPLVAHTFDIERHGKAGDTSTQYEIYEVDHDDTRLEDLPELPDILGGVILDKTADDMNYFLDNGYFPNNDGAPNRNRSERSSESQVTRRTPASQSGRGSRRGDNF